MTFTPVPTKAADYDFTHTDWNLWARDNINKGIMRPLAHNHLGVATSTISWTSISADFEHLVIMGMGKSDDTVTTFDRLLARFNNDTGGNYDAQFNGPKGATAAWVAGRAINQTSMLYAGWLDTALVISQHRYGWAPHWWIIPHYAGTTQHKTLILVSQYQLRNSTGTEDHFALASSNIWRNTAAVNRIDLFPQTGDFAAGSQMTLYGVAGV